MSDQTRLEDAFRAGLQRRADDVDTTVDLLGPARRAARAQRRRRYAVTGAVGLAAAALVTAVVVQDPGGSDGPDGTQVVDRDTSEPLPTEWRTEAWHGLQVEVPADWGWGAAPTEGSVDLIRCGGPDDGSAYVGRPVASSDVCRSTEDDAPTNPYVWLGADIEPGTKDLANGFVRTTIAVEGTTLTVASDDRRLAQRILDSAAPVRGCAAHVPSAPVVESMLMEGLRNPSSAEVCAYRREPGAESWDLVYATTLGKKDAATYHSQVYDGGFESSPDFCDNSSERVLITITGEDPYGGAEVAQATVVDPFCREVSGSPGMVTALSDKGMAAWSHNGAAISLYSLIGPQG